MSDHPNDPTPVRLRQEDRADDAPTPAARVETNEPRRVRSQLVAIDGRVLGHQDDAERLFAYVSDRDGRAILRALFSGLEETHELLGQALDAVKRGV